MTAQEIITAVKNAAIGIDIKPGEVDMIAQFIMYCHLEMTFAEVAELYGHYQHRLILHNVEIIGVRLNIYEDVRGIYDTVMGQWREAA